MIRKKSFPAIVSHAILGVGVLFSVFPFYWMVLASLRSSGDTFNPEALFWPAQWDALANYQAALTQAPTLRFMINGVIVCGGILLAQIATALPCAYAIAKLPFRGKNILIAMIILCMAIPFQAVALPLFVGLSELRLLNTFFALMSPFFVSALAILMLAQFLRGYPNEVIEAARLDGMSEATIMWRLIIPSARPAIAAFAIFSIAGHWNDLYWPMIAVTSPDLAPPTLGILFFRSEDSGDKIGPMMAAGTLITLPLVIVFLIAQRRFVQGITLAGIK